MIPSPAPDIAIRARPPSPRRLSRKVLLSGALLLGGTVVVALLTGLSGRPDARGAAAATASAAGGPPASILDAPAIYDARDLGAGEEATPDLAPPDDPFWSGERPARESGPDAVAERAPAPSPSEAKAASAAILFARADPRPDAGDVLDARLDPPASPFLLQAGQVIPAALVTALNSDLKGRVIAQVTAPVHDSVTGAHLLIPQGARLLGTYQNKPSYGEERVFLAWDRLILPNGWSIALKSMEASDPSGAAGLSDRTDRHLDRLAGAVFLSSILSVAANEVEDEDEDGFTQSLGDAAAQQAAQTGARIVERELSVRPTLRVRAGAPVRVLVTRDIVLKPYEPRP